MWQELEEFPHPAGLKGSFILNEDDIHLIAGGSTFPVPAADGGKKVYFDTVYQLFPCESGNLHWRTLEYRLPYPMAEGWSVALDSGTLWIGGNGPDGIRKQVLLVSWDAKLSRLTIEEMPQLPVPVFHPAATRIGRNIYIAGGHDGTRGTKSFLVLSMDDLESGWQVLPSWPGPPRFGAILEALNDGEQNFLYLFSGKTHSTNPRSQANYLKDVYRFELRSETWQRLSDMPRAALIGVPAKINDQTLAILSGSDGHDIDRLEEIGQAYRLPKDILLYSPVRDKWTSGGNMPLGVIGVQLLPVKDGFILASGEYSPGLRSKRVFHLKPNFPDCNPLVP